MRLLRAPRHGELQCQDRASSIPIWGCFYPVGRIFALDIDTDLFMRFSPGGSLKRDYRKLLVAAEAMRSRFITMIEREAEHARAGKPARIVGKMNALEDIEVIQALYKASQAGVSIDLVVRGLSCHWRPGRAGAVRTISA